MKNNFEKENDTQSDDLLSTLELYRSEQLALTKQFCDQQLEILTSKLKQETERQVLETFQNLRSSLESVAQEVLDDYEGKMKEIKLQEEKLRADDSITRKMLDSRKQMLRNSLSRNLNLHKKLIENFVGEFL